MLESVCPPGCWPRTPAKVLDVCEKQPEAKLLPAKILKRNGYKQASTEIIELGKDGKSTHVW